jgi:hypothetical protein
MSPFIETVERETAELCNTYRLSPRVLSANDVLLVCSEYALRFRVDRDGVSTTYIDPAGDELQSYELFGFLLRERRDQLTFATTRPTPSDEVRAEVAAMVRHLFAAGKDILAGEKDWQSRHGFVGPATELAASLPELWANVR